MGMLLSGGVDSSTVLAKSLENGAEIEAFTLRYSDFQNSTFSEIPFSEFVCNHLNVNLNKIILNEEDFISLIPISIGEQDGNSMDPTIIAYNKIGKVVRSKNIKLFSLVLVAMKYLEVMSGFMQKTLRNLMSGCNFHL